MQKLAMRLEGTRRKHVQKWNNYEDKKTYAYFSPNVCLRALIFAHSL